MTLRSYIRQCGIEQKELAITLGVSRSHVNRCLKGEREFSREAKVKLRNILPADAPQFEELMQK